MDSQPPAVASSYRTHKRQLAWQILVPFLFATVVILAVAVLFATGMFSSHATWADISVIWMILPVLILAIVFTTLLCFMIYGISRLLKVFPKYSAQAQYYAGRAADMTHQAADGAAKPVIWVQQAAAIVNKIFKL